MKYLFLCVCVYVRLYMYIYNKSLFIGFRIYKIIPMNGVAN